MTPAEDAEALHAEVKALRAEVREVVAILENWERRPPTVTTRSGGGASPSRRHPPPMMVRPEGQE